MRGNFPIANASAAHEPRTVAVSWSLAVRQFFRPSVLACLALAITVGGWGYGYKLSQYLLHTDVTKASHTRMWVDHRDDSFKAGSHAHRPQTLPASGSFDLSTFQTPPLARELVFSTPLQSRILTFVSPLHPLRAPPISYSSLA